MAYCLKRLFSCLPQLCNSDFREFPGAVLLHHQVLQTILCGFATNVQSRDEHFHAQELPEHLWAIRQILSLSDSILQFQKVLSETFLKYFIAGFFFAQMVFD